MNTLIAYGTKYGCTEKCAKALAEKIRGEVDLCNLKTQEVKELSKYDNVIIGGSIYIGKIQRQVEEFSSKNLNLLKEKRVGLFICGMREEELAETELNDSFPQELLDKAIAKEFFGGEFVFSRMNFLERFIVKKIAKINSDTSNILEENINRFAELINEF